MTCSLLVKQRAKSLGEKAIAIFTADHSLLTAVDLWTQQERIACLLSACFRKFKGAWNAMTWTTQSESYGSFYRPEWNRIYMPQHPVNVKNHNQDRLLNKVSFWFI